MSKLKLRLKYGEKNYLVPIQSSKTLLDLKSEVEKRFKIMASGFQLDDYNVSLEDEIGDLIEDPKKEWLKVVEAPRDPSRERRSSGPHDRRGMEEIERKLQALEKKCQDLTDENKRLNDAIEAAENSEEMALESARSSKKACDEMAQVLATAEANPPVASRSTKMLLSLTKAPPLPEESNRKSSQKESPKAEDRPEPEKEDTPEELDPSHPHFQTPTPKEPENKEDEFSPVEEKPEKKPGQPEDDDPWAVIEKKMAEKRRKKKEKDRAARGFKKGESPTDKISEEEAERERKEQAEIAQQRIQDRMKARMSTRTGPRLKLEPTRPRRKSAPQSKLTRDTKESLKPTASVPEEGPLPESDDEHYGDMSPRSKISSRMGSRMKNRTAPRKSLQPTKRALQLEDQERKRDEMARRKSAPDMRPKSKLTGKPKGGGKLSKKDEARVKRMNIKIGDKLEISGAREGILKYMGEIEFAKGGYMFGLELIGGALGDHSGTVEGVEYFTCASNRGVFITAPEIRRKPRQAKPKESKRSVYKRRLTKVLQELNPMKVKSIDSLLDKNEGNIHNLYVKVCTKYFQKPEKEYFDDTENPPK